MAKIIGDILETRTIKIPNVELGNYHGHFITKDIALLWNKEMNKKDAKTIAKILSVISKQTFIQERDKSGKFIKSD